MASTDKHLCLSLQLEEQVVGESKACFLFVLEAIPFHMDNIIVECDSLVIIIAIPARPHTKGWQIIYRQIIDLLFSTWVLIVPVRFQPLHQEDSHTDLSNNFSDLNPIKEGIFNHLMSFSFWLKNERRRLFIA